jgi:NAD(P)-dependent dehydrogenase (short-subunit alcohol dehydrogenase family)
MELFDLTGKVAVITGSSKGIGKAIAERMAEHGAKVVISSRKAAPCQEVADAINAKHGEGRAIVVPANIASKEDLQRLVDETNAAFGQIDILVCNAASNPYAGPMGGISDERKDGAILVISSVGGLRGNALIGAYNVSKAADMQLVRNLAVEFGSSNVRVNCIAPGLIQTDFAKYLWENPEVLKVTVEPNPMKRIGQPDEIAGTAVYLCSKAAAYVTGQTLVVDGGLTIAW